MEGASCAIQERVGSISLRFRASVSEVHLTGHRLSWTRYGFIRLYTSVTQSGVRR